MSSLGIVRTGDLTRLEFRVKANSGDAGQGVKRTWAGSFKKLGDSRVHRREFEDGSVKPTRGFRVRRAFASESRACGRGQGPVEVDLDLLAKTSFGNQPNLSTARRCEEVE